MLDIDKNGMIIHKGVLSMRYPAIEHGRLVKIKAIVVHQTDTSTDQQTFNSYAKGGNGAHFLIGTKGTVYQTASVNKVCYHVGRHIRSRCLQVSKKQCQDAAAVALLALKWRQQVSAIDAHERTKEYPERYPVNLEALGVEVVGKSIDDKTYDAVTPTQNLALSWLLEGLYALFSVLPASVREFVHSRCQNGSWETSRALRVTAGGRGGVAAQRGREARESLSRRGSVRLGRAQSADAGCDQPGWLASVAR